MNADREEFSARVREKAADRQAQAMPMIRAAAAVAPIMDRLMTTPDWDRYLQYLQARIDQAAKAREGARSKLEDSSVDDMAEIRRLKTTITVANSMISAWEFSMSLPKALSEGGNAALELANEFEKKNEPTSQPKP